MPFEPFGPEKKEGTEVLSELVKRINKDTRRIRSAERRIERIEKRIGSIEESALTKLNDLKIDLEKIGNEISLISKRLDAIEDDISRVNKELEKKASKMEIKQMESFIDLVNPITSKFVTKEELERRLEERLKRKR